MKQAWLSRCLVLAGYCLCGSVEAESWPAVESQMRPWVYNHWMGSAVDETNLVRELTRYQQAGLGGIHIIPTYPVRGSESNNVSYLSPRWMELFAFTVNEAKKRGMGVDMTTGTGWCFGGPTIPIEASVTGLAAATGTNALPKGFIPFFTTNTSTGARVVLGQKPGMIRVKRSSPGGEGWMINPLYPPAMERFLQAFSVFDAAGVAKPRAVYHDSFEYYGTGWSPDFFAQFAARRGYAFQDHAAALAGLGDRDYVARVKCDFRETASDVMIVSVFARWAAWARQHGFMTRNEAHGACANLLDFYALADVPETEMFGRGTRDPLRSGFGPNFQEGDRNILISKMASSAAHVTGKKLVSSESCTWIAEHFCETLEEIKCFVDLLFLSGVNHVFYHGTTYSPDEAAWPGWCFYASLQMNPRNPIWHDVGTLNQYMTRCQSMFQTYQPDAEILLYWPIHALWQNPEGLLNQLTVHDHRWLTEQPVGHLAKRLWQRGYAFDYVSDRLLRDAAVGSDKHYRAVVVPRTQVVPLQTLTMLLEQAKTTGCVVVFEDALPNDVPGFAALEQRRVQFKKSIEGLSFQSRNGFQEARIGKGFIRVGAVEAALAGVVQREPLVDQPDLLFTRFRSDEGKLYFVVNQNSQATVTEVPLAVPTPSAVVMDPLSGAIREVAVQNNRVPVCLPPGHSVIIKTKPSPVAARTPATEPKQAFALDGPWSITFIAGGPTLPAPLQLQHVAPWTATATSEYEAFSGTAVYRTQFDAPRDLKGDGVLDLGRVCHSVRVRVNGTSLGTLIMAPYTITLPRSALQEKGNVLELEVTNLGANRIRYMDQNKLKWKIFSDINIVNIQYKPFDASSWPVLESGLEGPVVLRY